MKVDEPINLAWLEEQGLLLLQYAQAEKWEQFALKLKHRNQYLAPYFAHNNLCDESQRAALQVVLDIEKKLIGIVLHERDGNQALLSHELNRQLLASTYQQG